MLSLLSLNKRFGPIVALHELTLDVADGETLAVLGPSGSGKSTLLRAIAGLEHLDSGTIAWNGRDLARVPAHQRGFGLMFQDYALFPHKDVAGNVGFGLRMQAWDNKRQEQRVQEVLNMVGLGQSGHRQIGNLSGGEAQRVALARTLAPAPSLVMLDEPLGSLDRSLREHLMTELREIFQRLEATVLYVTHDQEEALTVADRVAVMQSGRLVQAATPEALWERPAELFVAEFLGFSNRFTAEVRDGKVDLGWAAVPVDAANGPTVLVIRPDALRVDPAGTISGQVVDVAFRGDHYAARVRLLDGTDLEVSYPTRPQQGAEARLSLDLDGVLAFKSPYVSGHAESRGVTPAF